MKNPPSKTQWKKLYNLADTVAELKPWKILSDYMVFGVRLSHYDTNGYVGIAGKHGQSRGVFVYMGEPSMERVRYMGNPEFAKMFFIRKSILDDLNELPDSNKSIQARIFPLPDQHATRNSNVQSEHVHETDDRIHVIKVALMCDKSVYRKIAISIP